MSRNVPIGCISGLAAFHSSQRKALHGRDTRDGHLSDAEMPARFQTVGIARCSANRVLHTSIARYPLVRSKAAQSAP
jgi:hypothetical protein